MAPHSCRDCSCDPRDLHGRGFCGLLAGTHELPHRQNLVSGDPRALRSVPPRKDPVCPGADAGRFPLPYLVLPEGEDGHTQPTRRVETNLRGRDHRRAILVVRLRFRGWPPCPAGGRSYFYSTYPCRASSPPRPIIPNCEVRLTQKADQV